ncbi:MAG: TolC family protein [Planctomycetota bacterium]
MTSRRQPPHRRRARRWVIVAGVAALSAGVAAAEPPLLRRLPPVDARPADVAPRFDPAVRTVATDGLTQPGFVTPLPAAITSGFVRHAAPGAEGSAPADEPISEPRPVRPAARPKPISRASPLSEAAEEVFPIDLANALGLGGAGHLQVRLARSRTYEAQANYLQAKANWLPSLSFAVAYNHHAGPLQETEGNVIEVSRSSLFVGGGVGPSGGGPLTAGAGGPPRMFVSWSLADAAFDPLVARQLVCAAGASGTVALNDALLDIALRYFELVEAYGTLANARLSEQAAADLVKQLRAFRASGLATLVDLQRVEIELAARRRAAADAERRTRTASAELARLLRLPPQVRLTPAEDYVLPVNFLGTADPVEVLIARGVASRPELAR